MLAPSIHPSIQPFQTCTITLHHAVLQSQDLRGSTREGGHAYLHTHAQTRGGKFTPVCPVLLSVERMSHYTNLEAEMPNFQDEPHPDQNVPSNWPQNGTITIRNLICTYRLGLPHVLKSVSLKIKGGERVGICGRTGSGKTTLLLALFRMLRTEGGSVIIDDQDISRLPLTFLRGRMAVIPQVFPARPLAAGKCCAGDYRLLRIPRSASRSCLESAEIPAQASPTVFSLPLASTNSQASGSCCCQGEEDRIVGLKKNAIVGLLNAQEKLPV